MSLTTFIVPEGVVGRTGSGKTSTLMCLFRLVEFEGDLDIDGVKIRDIGNLLLPQFPCERPPPDLVCALAAQVCTICAGGCR